jgi:hypothetical protein
MAKEIQLTQGKVSIVDDEDFETLRWFRWCYMSRGYAVRSSYGERREMLYLHRVIMQAPPGLLVDHINGDKLDNRRENLRLCSARENLRNRRPDAGSTSPYKGVSWNTQKQRWIAVIHVDRRAIQIGVFTDEIEAAYAYDRAAEKYFGEFAWLNFPGAAKNAA